MPVEGINTRIEVLVPRTVVAGTFGELAEVSRVYTTNARGALVPVGPPQIKVLWGVTIAQKRAQLTAEKTEIQLRADAQKVEIDDQLGTIP